MAVDISAVEAAAERIKGRARVTPVLTSPEVDAIARASVFLKAESLQLTGSFKLRGVLNKMMILERDNPEGFHKGVVVASSGNAGCAVAYCARLLGTRCTVFMPREPPSRPPSLKRVAAAANGATVQLYDRERDDRDALRNAFRDKHKCLVVESSNDEDVIAGQGTVALEMMAQAADLDVVVVPVAGGGLLAGTAVAASSAGRPVKVVGVEPVFSPDMRMSLARRDDDDDDKDVNLTIREGDSDADALMLGHPSPLAVETCRRLGLKGEDIVLVDDESLRSTVRLLFRSVKLVVEPGGAAALAAVLSGAVEYECGQRVGVVLSGGNVSGETFARLVS